MATYEPREYGAHGALPGYEGGPVGGTMEIPEDLPYVVRGLTGIFTIL